MISLYCRQNDELEGKLSETSCCFIALLNPHSKWETKQLESPQESLSCHCSVPRQYNLAKLRRRIQLLSIEVAFLVSIIAFNLPISIVMPSLDILLSPYRTQFHLAQSLARSKHGCDLDTAPN